MNRAKLLICSVTLIAILACNQARGEERLPEMTKWVLPVVNNEGGEELEERITKLKKILKNQIEWKIGEKGRNPGCVFWVEITHWQPNPGQAGYVIIIQSGGSVLYASNLKQLDLAIERLETVRIVKPNGVYLPVGLLTNYRLIETQ